MLKLSKSLLTRLFFKGEKTGETQLGVSSQLLKTHYKTPIFPDKLR